MSTEAQETTVHEAESMTPNLPTSRILITGGTGFIGSRLALACLQSGHTVTILGQQNTPAESQNRELLEQEGCNVVLASVTEPEKLDAACCDIDIVFHLAAVQHEMNVPDDRFWDVNVEGTKNLLEAAVRAGVTQKQGTINGYGERTGNANLTSIIANLKLKLGVDVISDEQLATLTDTSVFIAETLNMSPHAFQPYVGASAFAHKGGLHAAAVNKRRESYEHVPPGTVGNRNAVVVSELSGRGNVLRRIRDLGLEKELADGDVREIVRLLKEQESRGFSYEGAGASFELLIRRYLPNYEAPFELVDFMVQEKWADLRGG
ncbi:MAG: NAD-dependent epimerase/dehydratase family protein, partial [Gemmatimonadetes bacterium]|nr:NAD-dependent epimerase/dehydratase family protein [Gemmatimonadota bacterium]